MIGPDYAIIQAAEYITVLLMVMFLLLILKSGIEFRKEAEK